MNELDMAQMATNSMHWYGPATFLRCPVQQDLKDTDVGLVGVPYSGGNGVERMQENGCQFIFLARALAELTPLN
jgi:hypothetical protein